MSKMLCSYQIVVRSRDNTVSIFYFLWVASLSNEGSWLVTTDMIVCRVPGRVGAVWRVTSVTPWRCDVSWRLRFRPQLYNCDICYQQTTALLPCPTLSSPRTGFFNFCHWYSLTLERPSLIGHLSKCPCWNWDSCSLNIHRLFCGQVS